MFTQASRKGRATVWSTPANASTIIACGLGSAVAAGLPVQGTVRRRIKWFQGVRGDGAGRVSQTLLSPLSEPMTIDCSVATADAAGQVATVSASNVLDVLIAAAAAQGLAADISNAVNLACSIASADAEGATVTLVGSTVIDGAVAAASALGLQVSFGGSTNVTAQVFQQHAGRGGVLVWRQASFAGPSTIDGAIAGADAAGLPAAISVATVLAALQASATASGFVAAISSTFTIPASIAAAAAAGLQSGVSVSTLLSCSIADSQADAPVVAITGAQRIPAAVALATAAGLSSSVLGAQQLASNSGVGRLATPSYPLRKPRRLARTVLGCRVASAAAEGRRCTISQPRAGSAGASQRLDRDRWQAARQQDREFESMLLEVI